MSHYTSVRAHTIANCYAASYWLTLFLLAGYHFSELVQRIQIDLALIFTTKLNEIIRFGGKFRAEYWNK